jgi:hypothetical protein
MTAYGIIGDVDASPKLVRAALSDLVEAHRRTTPADEFWLTVGVRNGETKIHDEILDWAYRNEVYFEVLTPATGYTPYIEPSKLTVSPSFMLDVVEMMHQEPSGKILALVGDRQPKTDVLRALAKAKDDGTEIRDLAEAGLTLILFRGDDPPYDNDNDSEEETMADEEVEASLAELGEYADGTEDEETAEQAQGLLLDAAAEAGLDADEYPTWTELAEALQEIADGKAEDAPEPEPVVEGLTREALVGKEISEIKQLAKAAGIEGYSKMRREALIQTLLGEEPASAPTPPAGKATGAAKAAAPEKVIGNGDATTISDTDVERIADAVVLKLGARLLSS